MTSRIKNFQFETIEIFNICDLNTLKISLNFVRVEFLHFIVSIQLHKLRKHGLSWVDWNAKLSVARSH